MKIFSNELSLQALIKNTQLGFRVLIDEWYWIILQSSHSFKIKQLDKEMNNCLDENLRNEISAKIENLNHSHEQFRKIQIETRLKAYF